MLKGKVFSQLSHEERIRIEVLLQQGLSRSDIARQLGRSASTISREINRNGVVRYSASRAQKQTERRHRQKYKHTVFDQGMIQFIVQHLSIEKWSPELISARGRQWRGEFVSHERIYQWIWKMKASQCKTHRSYRLLYNHLKHGHRRKRRGKQHNNRGNIIDRRWIDQRPGCVNNRRRQGDLEVDTVMGKGRKASLLVAIDRKTRKTWIRPLANREAAYVMQKLKQICRSIGNVKTVTLDNDPSFAHHYQLHQLGIDTFFTHPFSSQEKGSVENRIGTIRRFFPKHTDFTQVKEHEVRQVQKHINNRPMRMFNYQSSNEVHIS